MKGIVPFYKPKGISSYDVIRRVKKWITETHIGHGGALDPLAEGLLILGIGREATKELGEILKNEEKEYEAMVRLGAISETYDGEGPIRENTKFQIPNHKQIEEALKNFMGEIWQTPPPYSAIKIGGEPAYARARRGEKIKLEPKKVFVKSIEILDYVPPDLKIKVITGSGVYIRSLAYDLGQILDCGAYLADLRRTRVGDYTIEQAITFDDIEKDFIELRAEIFGNVQGVGFRFFALREGEKFELVGWVRNTGNRDTVDPVRSNPALAGCRRPLKGGGRTSNGVEVLAQGCEKSLQQFLEKLERGPLLTKIEKVEFCFQKPYEKFSEFLIKY